jgi:hypothetical protein
VWVARRIDIARHWAQHHPAPKFITNQPLALINKRQQLTLLKHATMPLTLEQLNAASAAEALQLLDGVYEHSPWIAEQALAQRPFRSLAHLKHAMAQAVRTAEPTRNWPDSRPPRTGRQGHGGQSLTAESTTSKARRA